MRPADDDDEVTQPSIKIDVPLSRDVRGASHFSVSEMPLIRVRLPVGERDLSVITVFDLNGNRSVTNDAEAVVRYCRAVFGPLADKRIVYRDSRGWWDEIVHDGDVFTGFELMSAITVKEAIAKLVERP